MKLMLKLLKSGVVCLIVMTVILFYTLSGIPDAYDIYLQEVIVQDAETPDQVMLLAKGANMYRPNSFYLDGKRIEDAVVEKSTYEQCLITVDRTLFQEGKWHRMELGFSKWNILNLLSSPIWIEWIY